MPSSSLAIPDDLMDLQPSDALESVSMSKLARQGTTVLQQILSTSQPVAVKVQGQGAMVTVSQQQYDAMVALIDQLKTSSEDDGFNAMLSQRFDVLAATMNKHGAANAADDALFGDVEALNHAYRPGDTEERD